MTPREWQRDRTVTCSDERLAGGLAWLGLACWIGLAGLGSAFGWFGFAWVGWFRWLGDFWVSGQLVWFEFARFRLAGSWLGFGFGLVASDLVAWWAGGLLGWWAG